MDKTLNILLVIASVGLAVAALIFICIAVFCDEVAAWIFPAGLICCALSNLFNIIRSTMSKNKEDI